MEVCIIRSVLILGWDRYQLILEAEILVLDWKWIHLISTVSVSISSTLLITNIHQWLVVNVTSACFSSQSSRKNAARSCVLSLSWVWSLRNGRQLPLLQSSSYRGHIGLFCKAWRWTIKVAQWFNMFVLWLFFFQYFPLWNKEQSIYSGCSGAAVLVPTPPPSGHHPF